MAEQATDFLDMMEFLYPEMQVHCQFDWYVACTHTHAFLYLSLCIDIALTSLALGV